MERKKGEVVQQQIANAPPYGYVEITSVLSDSVEIRFSVPVREWNELQESKEWKDFQSLLEKVQREHNRKEH